MSYIYEDCYRYKANGTIASGVVVPLYIDLACTVPASPSSVTTDTDGFGRFTSAVWPIYYKVGGDTEGHRANCVSPPGSGGSGGGPSDWDDVTAAPYNADNTGATDPSTAINACIAASSVGDTQACP